MKIIDAYLARRLTASICLYALVLVMAFVLVDLVTHRQFAIAEFEIPASVVAAYYLNFAPTILFNYHFLAFSVLLGTLIVLGRAAETWELTALLSAGVSLYRIALVPLLIGGAIAAASFLTAETLGVSMTDTATRIERQYFQRAPEFTREGVTWPNLEGGWICHIAKFNDVANTGENVVLHSFGDGSLQDIRADRIYWDEIAGKWILEDGVWYVTAMNGGQSIPEGKRFNQRAAPIQEVPEQLFVFEKPAETMPVWELYGSLKTASARGLPTNAQEVEFHTKFAQPFMSLIMVLLAIPFVMRLRKGAVSLNAGISIVIGLAFLLVYSASIGAGHLGLAPPFVSAWLPCLLFLGFGLGLLKTTPT